MSHGKTGPKNGPSKGPSPVNAALALTDTEVVESVSTTVRRAYRGNLKMVATHADVREDTAKNWMEGRNAPNLATFFRLARNCPELRAEAMRLMGMETEMNPEFMRDVMVLMQTWKNYQAAKA